MRLNDLMFLEGKWSGQGVAEYPTINNCEYSEQLIFEYDKSKNVIFYIQRTKFLEATKSADTLHLESGFMKLNDEGSIELSNSQNNGRVEVLTLKEITIDGGETKVLFTSKLFGNDPRMVRTEREYILHGDSLSYVMKMATVNNNSLKTHLKAELKRDF
ncbi:MAG: FABP family protein [Ignavibacteria bacterium]